jgi:uncharacterized repeat protein (TIGR01451 family)
MNASEERVNLDRRWLGTSVVRVRVLAAGLVLLAAGCMVLGWGSRSRQTAANRAASTSAQGSAQTAGTTTGPILSGETKLDARSHALAVFAGLPLMFEPNQGQANLDPADARVKFVARGSGYSLYLGSEGAILNLRSQTKRKADAEIRVESLQMKLAGANPNASVSATDPLPGKSNYILGNDPSKWRQGIPQFARVRYENVYPGINLVFYGNQGRLEYDFQVAPGSDPRQAELEFKGAKKVELHDGALVIKGEGGDVQLDAPRVYQEIAGRQEPVEGSFVLRGANRAGFAIGNYDHSRELVIDPQLTYSTYFGGSGDESHVSIAVDGSFNMYLTGSTTSANLPALAGVYQQTLNGTQNVFIAKIVPTLGSNPSILTYVTYLGGEGVDYPVGIAVDGAGNPYVAGTTTSALFPTTPTTAYQTAPEASTGAACPGFTSAFCHVFVTELNNNALGIATQLLYSSYLSGNGNDIASGMTIDASGDIFVTGTTTSQETSPSADQFPATNLPQKLPYQSISRAALGQPQFFVTKVNTNGSRLGSILYSTYFGGGTFQTTDPIATGGSIAVDTNGNMYFTGTTNYTYTGTSQTTDFPILNPYQPCLDIPAATQVVNPPICTGTTSTSNSDAFVAKINPNAAQGQQLLWSTYFGGTQTETGTGIALDTGAANVYITGATSSSDITTALTFAAYQSCIDQPVNPLSGVPCTNSDPQTAYPTDAYVARLSNPTTNTTGITNVGLTYFSYLGGTSDDAGLATAVDVAGGALVTGWTKSADFPVNPAQNSIQSAPNGPQNAFMARLNAVAQVGQTNASWSNPYGGNNTDEGTSIALDIFQTSYFAGDTTSDQKIPATGLQTTIGGGSDAFIAQVGSSSTLSITGVLTVGTGSTTIVSAGMPATFTYTVTNGGPDPATGVIVQNNISQSITGIALTFNSATATSGTCSNSVSTSSTVACTIPTLQAGSTATVTFVLTPTATSSGTQPQSFNGGSVQVLGTNNIILAHTTVSATMGDYTITVLPSSQSVAAAGDTATYAVQLTPHPVYATNVALSCSGTPPASSCAFTTPSVSMLGGPATSTLNVTTTARPIVTPAASLWTRRFYAVWLCIPGLAFFGLGKTDRRRRIAGVLMLCALFGLLVLQPACSKGTTPTPVSGTPAGQYNIIVTGAAGTDSKSATISLNVP